MLTKSLFSRQNALASADRQISVLEQQAMLPPFPQKLEEAGLPALRAGTLEIFQINLGKMCNQTCAHCHVDAGPDRKEIMNRETMQQCLDVLRDLDVTTVDLTGGAPEMNPEFRWFVGALKTLGKRVIVRCNLTILLANRKYHDLPEFYRDHQVELASSLPFYNADRTDRQRGDGVFKSSITALQMLNRVGYGIAGSGLILNLVYNPAGAFLPSSQEQMEKDFKAELSKHYDIQFNSLFCITNMPISRYLEYLLNTGNYQKYMDRLVAAFNPAAARNVMCRNTLSVSWDGYLYDCDFNQMLEIKVDAAVDHIRDFASASLNNRLIRVNQHCYGCTAGSGSSCSGSTT